MQTMFMFPRGPYVQKSVMYYVHYVENNGLEFNLFECQVIIYS